MSGAWDTIREAVATKINGDSGVAAAGLRRAITDIDAPIVPPEARVLVPAFTMLSQSGSVEQYLLNVPVEVVVPVPSGRGRSSPIAADIARAIQVAFQSDVDMSVNIAGLDVVDARIMSAVPGLQVYAEDWDGYRLDVQVQVYEIVSRTP